MAPARPRCAGHGFRIDPIEVAFGLGVDPVAMLIGLRDRGVPIAIIMFADTGSEKPETYAYLPIIQEWLAQNGIRPCGTSRECLLRVDSS